MSSTTTHIMHISHPNSEGGSSPMNCHKQERPLRPGKGCSSPSPILTVTLALNLKYSLLLKTASSVLRFLTRNISEGKVGRSFLLILFQVPQKISNFTTHQAVRQLMSGRQPETDNRIHSQRQEWVEGPAVLNHPKRQSVQG